MVREMIKVENGHISLNGCGNDLLTDLSVAVAALLESFVENGLPADAAKHLIKNAVTVGFIEGAKNKKSDRMGGVLNELYETLGDILGKAGKDNGSK